MFFTAAICTYFPMGRKHILLFTYVICYKYGASTILGREVIWGVLTTGDDTPRSTYKRFSLAQCSLSLRSRLQDHLRPIWGVMSFGAWGPGVLHTPTDKSVDTYLVLYTSHCKEH